MVVNLIAAYDVFLAISYLIKSLFNRFIPFLKEVGMWEISKMYSMNVRQLWSTINARSKCSCIVVNHKYKSRLPYHEDGKR